MGFSLFVIVVGIDVTLNVQVLIKFTTITKANPLQSHFTLVKKCLNAKIEVTLLKSKFEKSWGNRVNASTTTPQ